VGAHAAANPHTHAQTPTHLASAASFFSAAAWAASVARCADAAASSAGKNAAQRSRSTATWVVASSVTADTGTGGPSRARGG
jgi:hypothetical protein